MPPNGTQISKFFLDGETSRPPSRGWRLRSAEGIRSRGCLRHPNHCAHIDPWLIPILPSASPCALPTVLRSSSVQYASYYLFLVRINAKAPLLFREGYPFYSVDWCFPVGKNVCEVHCGRRGNHRTQQAVVQVSSVAGGSPDVRNILVLVILSLT